MADTAHLATDKKLEEMEKRLSAIYSRAEKTVQKKMADYAKSIDEKSEELLQAYKDAETGASEATLHDDRAYCLALAGLFLQEKRLEHIRNKKRDIGNIDEFFEFKRPKSAHSYFN